MKGPKRQYTAEFKAEAVRLAKADEASIRKVAARIGVPAGTLTTWVREAGKASQPSSPALTTDERHELQRLRRENERLQQERDFLKEAAAAAAFFARENE